MAAAQGMAGPAAGGGCLRWANRGLVVWARLLINGGYRILRFTAADIHNRAEVVVAQVRAALEDRRASKRTPNATRAESDARRRTPDTTGA
jgi:hypothetical protein